MKLKKSLNKIEKFVRLRYGRNLAGLLVFGSVVSGDFVEGKSDIDVMILLKDKEGLNFEEEILELSDELGSSGFVCQYFHTLRSIKDYVLKRKSWGVFVVIASEDGAFVLFSSKGFKSLKDWFKSHPLTKNDCVYYLKEKQKTDVNGYFKERKGFEFTKSIFAHIRKQLQMLNFFKSGKLLFDYEKCLRGIEGDCELKELYERYKNRKGLSVSEGKVYYDYIRKLNNEVKRV